MPSCISLYLGHNRFWWAADIFLPWETWAASAGWNLSLFAQVIFPQVSSHIAAFRIFTNTMIIVYQVGPHSLWTSNKQLIKTDHSLVQWENFDRMTGMEWNAWNSLIWEIAIVGNTYLYHVKAVQHIYQNVGASLVYIEPCYVLDNTWHKSTLTYWQMGTGYNLHDIRTNIPQFSPINFYFKLSFKK